MRHANGVRESALIFDCHDEAYAHWRDAGIRGATLVHVDAHHDLEPGPPSEIAHIGNFVRLAIADGIVARLRWVLPQPMWDHPATRAVALHDLAALAAGVDASVAPLGETAGCAGPVLLDIDLDYLFTTAFDRDPSRAVLAAPWCDVDALAAALAARWPCRRVTTIATSLTGSFTPIGWKHLARPLAARLDGTPLDETWDRAARDFQEAERQQARGALVEARARFASAVAADPQYRHPFRTPGHLYLAQNRRAEAARAFDAALALDPDDGWARLGLAMIAMDEHPADALASLGDVDAGDRRVDAWRTRSRALAAIGDLAGAIAAARRVLALALDGAVPLSVWASNRDGRLVDPDHMRDHARLASLYRRAGDAAGAAAHQRIAEAAGVPLEEPV